MVKMDKKSRGFTLVILSVTIAILAILFIMFVEAIGLGVYDGPMNPQINVSYIQEVEEND